MGDSLQKRIYSPVTQIFARGNGAWLVWCDPARHWGPLLKSVANNRSMGVFPLRWVWPTLSSTGSGLVLADMVGSGKHTRQLCAECNAFR
ncbi:MAG TPA: hypothetical protein PKE45_08775 [Caldilineaceae bacterium]|nr:hypothetical protein [Caldilineaceae bacterium]